MILELPGVVSRLISLPPQERPLCFVAVHSAKAVFLGFREGCWDPQFVVTVRSEEEVTRLHEILSRLCRMIPTFTAESLARTRLHDDQFIHVQSAIPGMPWASLAGSLGPGDQRRLYTQALDLLRELHAAIDAVPPWHAQVSPSDELRRQLDLCAKHGITLSPDVLRFAESCVESLAELGELVCHWQHGDFCADNLMVAGTEVRIFDFDEFGLTAMPLHDEFALALSVHELGVADRGRTSAAEHVQTCVAAAIRARPHLAGHLRSLFVHHLLWHLNLRHGQPARAARMKTVLRELEQFAAAPGKYIPSSP